MILKALKVICTQKTTNDHTHTINQAEKNENKIKQEPDKKYI